MTTLADLFSEVYARDGVRRPPPRLQSQVGQMIAEGHARAPRPLPRRMRPADVRANDTRLAPAERQRAFAEVQQLADLPRLARTEMQAAPDPDGMTPLARGAYGLADLATPFPSAYRAGQAAARGNAGDAAINTAQAGLFFLPGLAGERAAAPRMREFPDFGERPSAAPDAGGGRVAATDLFPETAPGPLNVYHGTIADFAPENVAPWSHFGTERAARDRLNALVDPEFRNEHGPNARVLPYEITGRRIDVGEEYPSRMGTSKVHGDVSPEDVADLLLRGRHITPEEHAWATEPLSAGRRFEGRDVSEVIQQRLGELAARHDIGAIGYRNAVEDAGSQSYIVPNPRGNVRPAQPARPRPSGSVSDARPAPEGRAADVRLAQLRQQGFDTDRVFYHGTDQDFEHYRGETWLSDAPARPNRQAMRGERDGEGANVRQSYVRGNIKQLPRDFQQIHLRPADIEAARREGYDGIEVTAHDGSRNILVFDPANIAPRFGSSATPNASAGRPPPRTPKSLPRRKPPSGGFLFEGPPNGA